MPSKITVPISDRKTRSASRNSAPESSLAAASKQAAATGKKQRAVNATPMDEDKSASSHLTPTKAAAALAAAEATKVALAAAMSKFSVSKTATSTGTPTTQAETELASDKPSDTPASDQVSPSDASVESDGSGTVVPLPDDNLPAESEAPSDVFAEAASGISGLTDGTSLPTGSRVDEQHQLQALVNNAATTPARRNNAVPPASTPRRSGGGSDFTSVPKGGQRLFSTGDRIESYASLSVSFPEGMPLKERPAVVQRTVAALLDLGQETDSDFGLWDRRSKGLLVSSTEMPTSFGHLCRIAVPGANIKPKAAQKLYLSVRIWHSLPIQELLKSLKFDLVEHDASIYLKNVPADDVVNAATFVLMSSDLHEEGIEYSLRLLLEQIDRTEARSIEGLYAVTKRVALTFTGNKEQNASRMKKKLREVYQVEMATSVVDSFWELVTKAKQKGTVRGIFGPHTNIVETPTWDAPNSEKRRFQDIIRYQEKVNYSLSWLECEDLEKPCRPIMFDGRKTTIGRYLMHMKVPSNLRGKKPVQLLQGMACYQGGTYFQVPLEHEKAAKTWMRFGLAHYAFSCGWLSKDSDPMFTPTEQATDDWLQMCKGWESEAVRQAEAAVWDHKLERPRLDGEKADVLRSLEGLDYLRDVPMSEVEDRPAPTGAAFDLDGATIDSIHSRGQPPADGTISREFIPRNIGVVAPPSGGGHDATPAGSSKQGDQGQTL